MTGSMVAINFVIHNEARFVIPDHVLTRRAAGETVLLNLADEQYYGLDGVGNRLWELIEGGTTFGEAVAALFEEYEVDRATLVADLTSLVAHLVDSRLVEMHAA